MPGPRKAFIVRICFRVDACTEDDALEAIKAKLRCGDGYGGLDNVSVLPDIIECPPHEWPENDEHLEPDAKCRHEG